MLYANASAVALTGNMCSSMFEISHSLPQGCPFSPLLFCLFLEPIAQLIRKSEKIAWHASWNLPVHWYFNVYVIHHNHFILKTFELFRTISGYRVNWEKSTFTPLRQQSLYSHSFIIKILRSCYSSSLNTLVENNYKRCFLPLMIILKVDVLPMTLSGSFVI